MRLQAPGAVSTATQVTKRLTAYPCTPSRASLRVRSSCPLRGAEATDEPRARSPQSTSCSARRMPAERGLPVSGSRGSDGRQLGRASLVAPQAPEQRARLPLEGPLRRLRRSRESLNAAQLARSLAVDGKTVARYLDLLVSIGRTNALFGKSIESPQVVDQAVNCHFEVVSAVIGRSSGLAGRENSHTSAQVATSPATGTTVTAPRRWDSQPRSGTRWISRTSSSGAAPGTAASAR